MTPACDVTLASEAKAADIFAISRLVSSDFREAVGQRDLARRLAEKGFQIKSGFLATAPHGKLICPLTHF